MARERRRTEAAGRGARGGGEAHLMAGAFSLRARPAHTNTQTHALFSLLLGAPIDDQHHQRTERSKTPKGEEPASVPPEMSISVAAVEARLREALEPSELTVVDTSGGCGASYEVSIVSAKLAGKTLLQRHRAINDALKQEMAHIHALSIKRAEAPPAEG